MNILKWLFKPSPNTLGRRGEDAVASKLSWAGIFGREGLTLQNVYLPTGNGKTVEIDLLYITVKGIFVIMRLDYLFIQSMWENRSEGPMASFLELSFL